MGGCSLSGDEAFSLWDTALACVWFKGLTFMACRPIIQSDCLCTDQRFTAATQRWAQNEASIWHRLNIQQEYYSDASRGGSLTRICGRNFSESFSNLITSHQTGINMSDFTQAWIFPWNEMKWSLTKNMA